MDITFTVAVLLNVLKIKINTTVCISAVRVKALTQLQKTSLPKHRQSHQSENRFQITGTSARVHFLPSTFSSMHNTHTFKNTQAQRVQTWANRPRMKLNHYTAHNGASHS